MKKQYWFVSVFGLWCLASAWWYLAGIKGVNTDPSAFKPEASVVSIIEILIMLIVTLLIGYAIAWSARGDLLRNQIEIKAKLKSDNSLLHRINADVKSQLENARHKSQREFKTYQQKLNSILVEREQLKKQNQELDRATSAIKQNLLDAEAKHMQLESEAGTFRYRIRQLEFQNKEQEDAYAKLKRELEDLRTQKMEKKISDHPFVRLIELNEKDDLTKIKGIGPFIEKRLNMIGIYTFKQLSELTPDLVDRVGAAIEFFPHRIIRDNWVGQAQSFLK
ncbi:MAG TPA: hypothetical protein DGG95_11675 [Cytophagales bacterium]|jgi:predicted flap endonuclease-1-like 5' DNA nuclease|nr:hypothetical protein [Cytophagales bacterium]